MVLRGTVAVNLFCNRRLIAVVPEPAPGTAHIDRHWWNTALHDERYGLIPLVREAEREMGGDFQMAQATCFESVRSFYRAKVKSGDH